MKAKAGLITLLVLLAIAYAGAKYYLHSSVRDKLDELVVLASPFVEITYGDISSDLRGSLMVDQIDMGTPDGEVLQVGSVVIEGDGPGFLLELATGLDQREPPESLVLKTNRLRVPSDQGFSAGFSGIGLGGQSPAQTVLAPCTLGGLLKHAGVDRIGMDKLVADSVIGYRFKRSQGEAVLFFDYDLKEIESISLNMTLEGLPEPGAMLMGVLPKLTEFDLSYQLQSDYIQRMVSHCAGQKKLSSADYLAELLEGSEGYFNRNLGFVPGPGLRKMIKALLSAGGLVQITATSPEELDPGMFLTHSPAWLIDQLGIEVTLNDKPVKDLRLAILSATGSLSDLPGLTGLGFGATEPTDETSADEGNEDASKPQQQFHMQYFKTRISELPRYIGSSVRLYTRNAPQPKQGFLVSYKNGTFSVEQNIYRGKLTAHVAGSDLVSAEVLRQVP